MDILGLISTYIRVVEAGSIAGAARAQGLSAAAVSQSLARLESHLGVRLLSRTTRRLAMTESGARYFEKVRHIPRDVETAAHLATLASEPQGPLRVPPPRLSAATCWRPCCQRSSAAIRASTSS